MRSFCVAAALVLVAAGSPAAGAQAELPTRLFERMARHVADREQSLVELRHDLHRHPELSGAEVRTAGRVAQRLRALGFDVRTGVGGHGVVGVLEGARSGPVVAFRADMDAVRSSADDPVAYASVVPGVRHICGHDVHTTVGVGLAEGFAAVRDELAGTVVLVFQPAEERGTGAKAMLADGAFESVHPDAILAVHTAPMPVGTVVTRPGGMMAGRASVSVTLSGPGDHEQAAQAVRNALYGIGTLSPQFSGTTAPDGFTLVRLAPQSATRSPGETVVRGHVMTAGPRPRERARTAALAALGALDLPDVTLETAYDARFMAGVTNDSALVQRTDAGIQALVPAVTVQTLAGAVPTFSEDFGFFQERTPGAMYFLGVSNPEAGTVGMPHSPDYVADDAAILVGVQTMLAAMLSALGAD